MNRPILMAPLALSLAACGGGNGDGDAADAMPTADAMISASCLEAEGHSDLTWIQDNIFMPSCAGFAACHDSDAPESDLDLTTEAASQAGLVGIDSNLEPGMALVAPGDPDQSYLMVILGQFGMDDPRIDPVIGTMPFANALLCVEKRDAIARWIDSLAAGAR
jgi:hypothetical protein